MPMFETLFRRLNPMLDETGIERWDPAQIDLEDPQSLRRMIRAAGIEISDDLSLFIDGFPPAMRDGFKAALRTAIQERKPVTLSWAPAYDFELHVWESRNLGRSRGSVNIQVRSRYPNDPHPLSGAGR